MPTNKEIVDYYDFSKLDYQIYNLASSNISMHFGIWDENVHNHKEALLNENRALAEIASLTSNDYVIDLGCGYGTTAIWLAKNIGCRVVGITISEKQVEEAKKAAEIHKVSHLTDFRVMDFNKTDFPDATFNVAIAIESICHASDESKVLKENYRILKPNGRLAIADGYLAKDKNTLTPKEQEIAKICFEGVHVPPLPERKEFEQWLVETGFSGIKWFDKTQSILKISNKISSLAKILYPISKIMGLLGIRSISTPHVKAFINQYYAWRDGLGVYGVFYGEKLNIL
ncbi:MAG: methyltransferase domain-containing protein [Minisyncoccia bacterium]|jgi:cyclopropane fatty-acyl-phospholipid synthase-like methyltransferase